MVEEAPNSFLDEMYKMEQAQTILNNSEIKPCDRVNNQ
jgi:hypothetical protein